MRKKRKRKFSINLYKKTCIKFNNGLCIYVKGMMEFHDFEYVHVCKICAFGIGNMLDMVKLGLELFWMQQNVYCR